MRLLSPDDALLD